MRQTHQRGNGLNGEHHHAGIFRAPANSGVVSDRSQNITVFSINQSINQSIYLYIYSHEKLLKRGGGEVKRKNVSQGGMLL